ncbi:MAG: degV family protein [Peptococcaceae bacterium BRH_c4b]|nr:MAG: degV family protein [Peptococcaceae bacterium BRH_c4b]
MQKVRIVTDSTADLDRATYDRYGITMVPLRVFFGQEAFLDGVEITPEQFFKRQVEGKEMSSTSQPTPVEFVNAYRPLAEEGSSIISLHISALMSGTIQSAKLAKTMLDYKELEIIDSRVTSVVLGLMVINAARAAVEGRSKEEIIELIRFMKDNHQIYFAVDTLEYLQRGGRIGKAQAFLGTLLNVKPILTIKDGYVFPHEKVRGRAKAFDRIVSIMQDKFGGQEVQCFLVHGEDWDGAAQLKEKAQKGLNCVEFFEGRLGPVVGTHVGPGVVGMVCLQKREPFK